eukprot:TRINITY_DN3894_c1_g2_i1.p1 TRINITY_DN3894_c1_g2~~TRINITY_DN3894_c1_g2_i1.p1  ORF type:complete len:458 (+),score=85.51 TRINITY_DN3894_c1_g2_i1:66-1376(+)
MRRVVVSGVGCVSPLGFNFPDTWRALVAAGCGVRPLSDVHDFASGFGHAAAQSDAMSCRVAASVPCGGAKEWQPTSQVPRYGRFALAAADEAMRDAGIDSAQWSDEEHDRAGVCVGVGIASLSDVAACSRALEAGKPNQVSPFFVPKILGNSPAGQIAMRHKLYGPCHSASTACATGAHSIGDAARFVSLGDADVMLAGGAEACMNPVAFVGFQRLRALTVKHNDTPQQASRPFDADRAGFVMGEGAAVLVLEEYERARARGANVYAELVGYGTSGDAHHVTAPDPEGRGSLRAMRAALRQAAAADPGGASPLTQLAYINAHATSTPLGDEIEANAVNKLVQEAPGRPPVAVSSTKGAVGHLLGAAGAIEAAFVAAAIRHRVLPPTLNLDNPFSGVGGVDFVRGASREIPADQTVLMLSNSFGFGGTNSCLAMRSC